MSNASNLSNIIKKLDCGVCFSHHSFELLQPEDKLMPVLQAPSQDPSHMKAIQDVSSPSTCSEQR